ncbi:hypothetical protein, partial [Streptomyces xanthochromogenes]
IGSGVLTLRDSSAAPTAPAVGAAVLYSKAGSLHVLDAVGDTSLSSVVSRVMQGEQADAVQDRRMSALEERLQGVQPRAGGTQLMEVGDLPDGTDAKRASVRLAPTPQSEDSLQVLSKTGSAVFIVSSAGNTWVTKKSGATSTASRWNIGAAITDHDDRIKTLEQTPAIPADLMAKVSALESFRSSAEAKDVALDKKDSDLLDAINALKKVVDGIPK